MVTYETNVEDVHERDLVGFFVGWPLPPTPGKHLSVLYGSDFVVLARDAESGRVVGYVTAVSDGVLSAYIPLLEVLPAYQGRGIGTELVRRLLTLLDGYYLVDLSCDEELVPFYERFGMQRRTAMGFRNRTALSE